MIKQMILVYFTKIKVKKDSISQKNTLENNNLFAQKRRKTLLCIPITIKVIKRYTPGPGRVVTQIGHKTLNPLCTNAQCGILPTINQHMRYNLNNNDNTRQKNNNINHIKPQNSQSDNLGPNPHYEAYQRQKTIPHKEPTFIREHFNKLSIVDSQKNTTASNDESKPLPCVSQIEPSPEHKANTAKVMQELLDVKETKQPLKNNPDGCIKPSTVKKPTQEFLTTREKNFRNDHTLRNNNDQPLKPESFYEQLTTTVIEYAFTNNLLKDLGIIQPDMLNNIFCEKKLIEISVHYDSNKIINNSIQQTLGVLDKNSYEIIINKFNACLLCLIEDTNYIKQINEKTTYEEKMQYLKKIKNSINNYKTLFEKYGPEYISRASEEYNKIACFLGNTTDVRSKNLLKHLEQEIIKDPRTRLQFIQKREYSETALKFLKDNPLDLPDNIFQEIVRRAGVIINNDVMHEELSRTIKEGEGPSLPHKVYSHFSKNPNKYIIEESSNITQRELQNIFNNVDEGRFFLGIIKNNDINKFIESGDEIHMNIITEITKINGDSVYIGLGHLTSNKNSTTIKLTDKQYINKTEEHVKKEQRFRPYRQLISFDKNSVYIYEEGTSYIKNTEIEGLNIQKIIIDAIKTNKLDLEKNPVRKPHIITKETLKNLAIDFYLQDINDMNKKIQDYDAFIHGKTPEECLMEFNLRQVQYDKTVKEQKDAFILREAHQEYKDAIKLKNELQIQLKTKLKVNDKKNN